MSTDMWGVTVLIIFVVVALVWLAVDCFYNPIVTINGTDYTAKKTDYSAYNVQHAKLQAIKNKVEL